MHLEDSASVSVPIKGTALYRYTVTQLAAMEHWNWRDYGLKTIEELGDEN
jgi:hypothetical protein